MKTIIYFLSVLAVLLCTSPGLLSQEREIAMIQNGKAIITNNANAIAFFKAVYGSATTVKDLNVQWSKEHNSYFLVGTTDVRGVAGLRLNTSGGSIKASAGPGIEITCAPVEGCHACIMSDVVCQCTEPRDASGHCEMMSKLIITTW